MIQTGHMQSNLHFPLLSTNTKKKKKHANIVMLGTVMLPPANKGFNLDDKLMLIMELSKT
jgi:hypothetical protein